MSSLKPPPEPAMNPPERGEAIEAVFLQAVAERIERLERRQTDPVAAVFAALPSDELVQVRITGRRFNGEPIPGALNNPALPSQITYDWVAIRRGTIQRQNQSPVYGREVRNDECLIYPALEGSVAYVVRSPDGAGGFEAELMLLPGCEVPARRRCGGGPGVARLSAGLLARLNKPRELERRRPAPLPGTPEQPLSLAAGVADSGGALSTETGSPGGDGGNPAAGG